MPTVILNDKRNQPNADVIFERNLNTLNISSNNINDVITFYSDNPHMNVSN